MSKTHVCLVSEQLLPNVIPVLHERPESVVLLTTTRMKEKAGMLADFLQTRGLKIDIRDIPAYDFGGVVEICRVVISEYKDKQLSLNVTGGTKVAALAAYQQFYFDGLRIIYVDTSNATLLELGDAPQKVSLEKNLLKVKDYLACYGKQVISCSTSRATFKDQQRSRKTAELAGLFVRKPELLLEVNRQITRHKEDGKRGYFSLVPGNLPEGGEQACLILREVGVATEGINGAANLNTREDLFYLHGGWLEEFVFETARQMALSSMDIAMNVVIEWRSKNKSSTKNELDIAFTACNRLHIISCKSSGLDRKGGEQKGKEALYELDSLAVNLGGLFARSMLVSAHKLGKASRQRAKDLGIEVIDGMDVLGLGKHIENKWLA